MKLSILYSAYGLASPWEFTDAPGGRDSRLRTTGPYKLNAGRQDSVLHI